MTGKLRLMLVATVIVVLAAACSGDDDDVTTDSTTTTTTEAAEPTESTEPAEATTTTTVAEELTASFRGVTATSIKVGIAVPDFDALQAAGVSNYQGDAEVAFQAFVDVINDNGGIHGRMIDPVYVGFDFVTPETQDVACSRFVEDEEVFIVLYGLLGANNLCLTERNQTMVMTRSFQTTDLREASGDTLWLQLNASDDARTRILATAVAQSGRLDGKTIGIIVAAGENDGFEGRVLQDTLTELGFESTLLKTTSFGGDPIARDGELGVIAERFKTEGVDFLFDLSGGGNGPTIFTRAGFTPELAFKALGASIDGAVDPALFDGAIGVGEINEQAIIADPGFQSNCMDVVREASPDLVEEMSFLPTGDQQAAGEPNWVNPVMIACDQTMLLKEIGELAGAELTNDSFRAALDELGSIELNGYGQASFGSESKWDGLDEFFIQEYDFETNTISVVGDAIVVDR